MQTILTYSIFSQETASTNNYLQYLWLFSQVSVRNVKQPQTFGVLMDHSRVSGKEFCATGRGPRIIMVLNACHVNTLCLRTFSAVCELIIH